MKCSLLLSSSKSFAAKLIVKETESFFGEYFRLMFIVLNCYEHEVHQNEAVNIANCWHYRTTTTHVERAITTEKFELIAQRFQN